MNRRDRLLKNDNTDKEKQVPNIRPDFGVSLETSSPKLSIEIVGDLIINGITPVRLSSKCKHRFRIKPEKSLLANNFIEYFLNMWLTILSDSNMSSPYQRNDKNQNSTGASGRSF